MASSHWSFSFVLFLRSAAADYIFFIACSRSAMMSCAFSIPTERRIRSGATPASRSCSSDIWRCVWLAGWSTQLRASATCVTMEMKPRLSMKRMASSRSPFSPKAMTPQVPPDCLYRGYGVSTISQQLFCNMQAYRERHGPGGQASLTA